MIAVGLQPVTSENTAGAHGSIEPAGALRAGLVIVSIDLAAGAEMNVHRANGGIEMEIFGLSGTLGHCQPKNSGDRNVFRLQKNCLAFVQLKAKAIE
jgi:hypothetical protein